MSEPFRVIGHGYQEPRGNHTSAREASDVPADIDSARLSGLLSDMDQLKQEILERMRRAEAVSQAKNLLREDAAKTEAITARIAEIQKIARVTPSGPELITPGKPQPLSISQLPSLDFRAKEALQLERSPEIGRDVWQMECDARASAGQAQSHSIRNDSPDPTLIQDIRTGSETNANLDETRHDSEQAENAWQRALITLQEAQKIHEESSLQLKQACAKEEQAANDLRATQQELTTAYQFAAAAAKMQKEAALYSQKSTTWAAGAVSMAWVAVVWIAWALFRARITALIPAILTALLLGIGIALQRWTKRGD